MNKLSRPPFNIHEAIQRKRLEIVNRIADLALSEDYKLKQKEIELLKKKLRELT